MKVLVVGNGLTGAYSSYLLARAGVDVICIGPSGTTGSASLNNPGGLNPLHGPGTPGPMSAFAMDCQRLHFEYSDALQTSSGIDIKLRRVQRLMLAVTKQEAMALSDAEQLYRSADGFQAELLDSTAIKQLPVEFSDQVRSALLTDGNAAVDSAAYNRALLSAVIAEGALLVDGEVLEIKTHEGRVSSLSTTGGEFEADAYLFCTGPSLPAGLPLRLPVKPMRGDLLRISVDQKSCPWDITWREFGLYRIDQITAWLGGTRADTGFDTRPDPAARRHIMNGLPTLVPLLAGQPQLEQCCGLRPASGDGLPIAGRLPGLDNALVATGSGAKGVLYSVGLARLLTGIITGENLDNNMDLLKPDRFFDGGVLRHV